MIQEYDKEAIKNYINNYFEQHEIALKNSKILLKPNLISPKPSGKQCNTHPLIIETFAEYLLDFNNKIFIGDSPGVGTLKLNLKVAGYSPVIKKFGIKIFPFNKTVEIKRDENKILKRFKISNAVAEFDNIINIAKLKTHCMTGMTLSVKNLFGFIVGKDKALYHLKAGHNIEYFADILIDIYETIKPGLNVIDGVWGMEGNGPTSGEPANFKVFEIGKNGYKLDRKIEKIVGFPGITVISKQAIKRGFLKDDNILAEYKTGKKIKLAKTQSANFRVPKFLTNFFTAKPVIDNQLCKKCLKCYESCPPGAIYTEENILKINYSKCIRCFCCHELCVYNAVKLRRFVF